MITPTKLLIIGIAIFVLYKLITKDKAKKATRDTAKDTKAKERKIASGELVKDPICGTYVDKEDSITVRDGKTVHHFCSYECRQQFLDQLEDSGREVPSIGERDER